MRLSTCRIAAFICLSISAYRCTDSAHPFKLASSTVSAVHKSDQHPTDAAQLHGSAYKIAVCSRALFLATSYIPVVSTAWIALISPAFRTVWFGLLGATLAAGGPVRHPISHNIPVRFYSNYSTALHAGVYQVGTMGEVSSMLFCSQCRPNRLNMGKIPL
jgi:hypothetical protein